MRLLYFIFLYHIINVKCGTYPNGTFASFNREKCYFVPDYSEQWIIAETICQNNTFGQIGNLTSIANAFENQDLTANLRDNLGTTGNVWLGGNDIGSNGVWTWIDGSNMTYTNWAKGNPLNDSISNCMTLNLSDGLWFSIDCYENNRFVCEIYTSICPPSSCYLPCPDGWSYFSTTNYCYKTFFNGSYFDFGFGEKICEQNKGYLVSIHSPIENEFLTSKYQNFIGLNYNFDSNTFKWTDNSLVDYINWDTDQPNITNNQYCVYNGHPDTNKPWSTSTCDDGYSFTCKQKSKPYGSESCSKSCCPDGWVYYSDTNFCYNHFGNYQYINFSDAENYCVNIGGHLLSIHSQEENDFIHEYFPFHWWPWIGLSYRLEDDTFMWTDNTTVDYRDWGVGQPNITENQYCVYVKYDDRAWYTNACNSLRDIVCKKLPNN